MYKCHLCYPPKEFDSKDEYMKHLGIEHAKWVTEYRINFNPLANEITIVILFVFFSILGSKQLSQHLWIGDLFIIEGGFYTMIYEYYSPRMYC
jgi:hypothetical protein